MPGDVIVKFDGKDIEEFARSAASRRLDARRQVGRRRGRARRQRGLARSRAKGRF